MPLLIWAWEASAVTSGCSAGSLAASRRVLADGYPRAILRVSSASFLHFGRFPPPLSLTPQFLVLLQFVRLGAFEVLCRPDLYPSLWEWGCHPSEPRVPFCTQLPAPLPLSKQVFDGCFPMRPPSR